MAEGDKKSPGGSRITDKERYSYIGFEVFPGTPKDLFKSEAEKTKLVESVKARRQSNETLRDDCKLLEERVSSGEKMILAIASVVMFLALFLPWYSAYTVVQDKAPQASVQSGGTTTDGEGVTSSAVIAPMKKSSQAAPPRAQPQEFPDSPASVRSSNWFRPSRCFHPD
jgi:hypothetical protein